ncbi:hypothetical protein KY285_033690 [Solanum tuberosum]|nr:hypothetical protein KY284_033530 [Solanum tuberosum]KAH0648442.1 hypothetical protein KY285_033690 [Solanum tuberosum]
MWFLERREVSKFSTCSSSHPYLFIVQNPFLFNYFLPTPNELECNNILIWTLLAPGSVLTEPQVYGRDKENDEIVKILINNVSDAQKLSVLPILGMGGLGKTTLSQMVFNDQRVTDHFYPKLWICVSNDFDEKRLIKAIIESIEGKSLSDMDLAPLQKRLQELLNGKRYLLVLDDVWNEDQQKWANLRAVLKVGASGICSNYYSS